MGSKLDEADPQDLRPRLTVIGVGGAGCNAINNMIDSGLSGVDFVVANTDAQALLSSRAPIRLQLGVNLTEGLGAGAKPEIGEAAAEEAIDDIRARLSGSHMVFIAAGMGGGTGTGAAAVIARAAKDLGILTVGVVTKPFQFEGARRMRIAEAGLEELKKHVDTLIVIPNQNLFRIANEKTTFAAAFLLADQVLYSGVACIVDLIVKDGLINLDFADVRTIMSGMGTAMMGTGEASGERRAIAAAEAAISNPLLDDISLGGAKGLLLSITGSHELTLYEVDEAASRVRLEVDPDANIIVGATFDPDMGDRVRVSIVASGMSRLGEPQRASVRAGEPWLKKQPSIEQEPARKPEAPVEGDDLRRRLSQAMLYGRGADVFPDVDPVTDPEPDSHRLWRAPDDVVIEDAPSHLLPPIIPRPGREGETDDEELDDFPAIVHAEPRAGADRTRTNGYDVDALLAQPVAPRSRRRAGFFERWTGANRRGDSADGAAKQEADQRIGPLSAHRAEPSAAPFRRGSGRG